MKAFTYTIQDAAGLHARPAGMLVKHAAQFACNIQITANGKSANAKKLFALMGLGVQYGDTIEISCDGEDETDAALALQHFLAANL